MPETPVELSIVMPAYNEEVAIAAAVDDILRDVVPHVASAEIVVVNDGSKDRTPDLLRSFPGVQVIRHPTNRGYGAGLKSAFRRTLEGNYEGLVTLDYDGQHEPSLIPEVAARLAEAVTADTWIQWVYEWDAIAGDHVVLVRATDSEGLVQTQDEAPPAPDGATGWHMRTVTVA